MGDLDCGGGVWEQGTSGGAGMNLSRASSLELNRGCQLVPLELVATHAVLHLSERWKDVFSNTCDIISLKLISEQLA